MGVNKYLFMLQFDFRYFDRKMGQFRLQMMSCGRNWGIFLLSGRTKQTGRNWCLLYLIEFMKEKDQGYLFRDIDTI